MSTFKNSPALQLFLRVLGTGETLSAKELHARSGKQIKRDQRERLADEGYLIVETTGRTFAYRLTSDGIAVVRDELGGPLDAPVGDTGRLGERERTALFALLSSEPQVLYSDVKRVVGVTIAPAVRESLSDKGLVIVHGRPIRFELTEKGWQTAEEELSRPASPGDPALLKVLHQVSRRALNDARAHGRTLVDMYVQEIETSPTPSIEAVPPAPKTVGARIIDAHAELAYEPGGWVNLSRLRDHLSDVDRDEVDRVLKSLFRDGRVKLIAEVNQRTLTDADRAAALSVDGDPKNLYTVG